jgi:hypothetical protein
MRRSWIAVVISFNFAAVAHAAGPSPGSITGNAAFEKRSTVVPMALCEGERCPKPEPYWVLVLREGKTRYELSTVFDRGSDTAPESIEVAGIIIRPGSRLFLEGMMHYLTRDYAIITNVHRVSVVMDLVTQVADALPALRNEAYPVWLCPSADGTGRIRAEVWNSGRVPGEADYVIRLLASGPDGRNFVSELGDTQVRVFRRSLTFYASAQDSNVELTLDQSIQLFHDVPARLNFRKVVPGPTYLPIEVDLDLVCFRAAVRQ